MPMGQYKDFAECTSDQMKKHSGEKGFKMENAQRICGFIKAKTESKMSEHDSMDMCMKKMMSSGHSHEEAMKACQKLMNSMK